VRLAEGQQTDYLPIVWQEKLDGRGREMGG